MSRLDGRVAVVTGASRGIGAAVAERLVGGGATVVGLARGFPDWERTDRRINARCDVTVVEQVERVARRVLGEVAAPDLVVLAAGSFGLAPLQETAPEDFQAQLATNLVGPFLVLRALLPAMQAAGRGLVITIGSIADDQGFPGNAAYAAGKWGVRGLHAVAAAEARAAGVRFCLLSPGPTDTALWDPVDPDARSDLPNRSAMMRPADVADAVEFVVTRPETVSVDVLRINPAG